MKAICGLAALAWLGACSDSGDRAAPHAVHDAATEAEEGAASFDAPAEVGLDASTERDERDAVEDSASDVAAADLGGETPSQSCREALASRGITYTEGPARPGVVDPVTVDLPLGGIDYFLPGAEAAQTALFLDCSLALALRRLADISAARGLVGIEYLRIYDYECISGTGDMDSGCTLSQHAFGTAIDVHALRTSAGAYSVESDWVIDDAADATCSAATESAADAALHQMVCEWYSASVFSVLLTPNYNAAQRSHFHLDLTPGANFIR